MALKNQKYHRLTPQDIDAIWARLKAGYGPVSAAQALGLPNTTVRDYVLRCGGIKPVPRQRREGRLTFDEREEISRRPKACKLAVNPMLAGIVAEKLKRRWSPQQIAGWLKVEYPNDPEMQVSHEAIYRTLFVQSRGALRRELTAHLRTHRVHRRPRGVRVGDGRGGRPGILHISERPAEAEDRAVPGHWEGDLVFGKGMTPVATLVERSTRYLMLVELPYGHKAQIVADALAETIGRLPKQLARSLTWDQGTEMQAHQRFTDATGIKVYFCDPKSPWQRGSNENTNGLLRQYMPKTVNFRTFSQDDLDAIALELNERPRQTLGFKTPSQALAEVLR